MRHIHGSAFTSLAGARLTRTAPLILALILPACGNDSESPGTASSKSVHGQTVSGIVQPGTPEAGAQAVSPAHNGLHTKALVPANGSITLTSSAFGKLYGPGVFKQDALANTVVGVQGAYEQKVSNRFRAQHNGQINSVRIYWQAGKGYASGTGGTVRLRILPDDGSSRHLPNLNATPLGTAWYSPGTALVGKGKPISADAWFSGTQALKAGQIYHLLMENLDGSPASNFISSNNVITVRPNGRPSCWVATTDWATLLGTRRHGTNAGFNWYDLTVNGSSSDNYYTPILQLNYSTGAVQGNSNMEGGASDPKQVFTASASQPVREQFRPSTTRQVSGLSVATSASVGGQLLWRIVENGNELASGTISQWSPNYSQVANRSGNRVTNYQWYDINLPRTITFRAGSTYDVEFLPQGSSQWKFADQRNGSDYGFRWPAAFTESKAQLKRDGQWKGAYHWDYNQNRNDANWPVVLHLN